MPQQRIWLYIADGRSHDDLRDLDHLDSLIWGANEHTRKGDTVLMYRGAPYRDIVYSFQALSNPRPADRRSQSYLPHVITLGKKRRVPRPVTLDDLRADPILRRWSVSRSPQGVMQRYDDLIAEGVWPRLKQLLRYRDESNSRRRAAQIAPDQIFLSYARENEVKVKLLGTKLAAAGLHNAWRDRSHIKPGDEWRDEIRRALNNSSIVVVCLSRATERKAKPEFFNTEVGWAINLANTRKSVVIIPVKLTECEVPRRLRRWHYAELFKPGGFGSLVERLKFQINQRRVRKTA